MKTKPLPFLLCSLLFLSAWSCTPNQMGQMTPYGGHMMNFGVGGVFMWLIFLALAGFIVYSVMQSRKSDDSKTSNETPLDIIKKRYAKGDISKEEFESLKRDIEN